MAGENLRTGFIEVLEKIASGSYPPRTVDAHTAKDLLTALRGSGDGTPGPAREAAHMRLSDFLRNTQDMSDSGRAIALADLAVLSAVPAAPDSEAAIWREAQAMAEVEARRYGSFEAMRLEVQFGAKASRAAPLAAPREPSEGTVITEAAAREWLSRSFDQVRLAAQAYGQAIQGAPYTAPLATDAEVGEWNGDYWHERCQVLEKALRRVLMYSGDSVERQTAVAAANAALRAVPSVPPSEPMKHIEQPLFGPKAVAAVPAPPSEEPTDAKV